VFDWTRDNIGRLDLLPKLYTEILIPPAVAREFGSAIEFLHVGSPANGDLVQSLKMMLGAGESEAIALAREAKCGVILDDKKARLIAERLDLQVIGTVGLLIRAKQQLLIPSIAEALDQLQAVAFFVSPSIKEEALRICKE
jgi:predicted nucleic acid-binding protein